MKIRTPTLIIGALILIVLWIIISRVQEGAVTAPSPQIIPSALVSLKTTVPPSGTSGTITKTGTVRSARTTLPQ
jgi:hypothetical protein